MITSDAYAVAPVWLHLTRFGEAQIVLPMVLLTLLALLLRAPTRGPAWTWLGWLSGAIALTTASKIAFLGWGIGWDAVDFTGISGHTMFASAVYPVMLLTFTHARSSQTAQRAVLLGLAVALLVGVSRVVVGAHSWSEVLAGWVVGGLVSGLTLQQGLACFVWSSAAPRAPGVLRAPLLPVALAVWILVTPLALPASQAHSAVIRLALYLSGHAAPFHRALMPLHNAVLVDSREPGAPA